MEYMMPVDQIIEIVDSAGEMAMSFYGRERGEMKADGTWVTLADHRIEAFLRERFHARFNARVFGEEGGWTGEADARYVAIVDPIDGTALFRDQIPIWGISVAIFLDRKPLVGIFSMPAAGHCFLGEFGKPAQLNGKPIRIPTPGSPIQSTSYLGISSNAHHWNVSRYPGKIRAFGASAFHVAAVASGALQAALLTRFHFYDIAAATIVLWCAGGDLYYLSGAPISPADLIGLDEPSEAVLACHPDHFIEIRKSIQPPTTL